MSTSHAMRTLVRVGCAVKALIICLLLCAGCGKEDGPTYAKVTGKVTLDGKPVQSGTVYFMPSGGTEGGAAIGRIDKEGNYTLTGPRGKGIVIGSHKVALKCPEEGSGPDSGQNPNAGAPPCKIPSKYADLNKPILSKTVGEGDNVIDIELSTKK